MAPHALMKLRMVVYLAGMPQLPQSGPSKLIESGWRQSTACTTSLSRQVTFNMSICLAPDGK